MFPLYPRSAPESSEGTLTEGEVVLVIVFLFVTPLRGAGGQAATARGDAREVTPFPPWSHARTGCTGLAGCSWRFSHRRTDP